MLWSMSETRSSYTSTITFVIQFKLISIVAIFSVDLLSYRLRVYATKVTLNLYPSLTSTLLNL